LEKLCNSDKELTREFGPDCAKRIRRRLDDMRAADNLGILRLLPQNRCHELIGDRDGQLAVDVKQPLRIVFEPADQPIASKADGGLDWERTLSIKILEVVDYHD
jgi:proteic killer suppression protein